MELRISRRSLRRWATLVGLLVAILGLAILGRSVTPRDDTNNPLLLSPSLKATLEYQAQAHSWMRELHELDDALHTLLSDPGDIYQQSQTVNRLLDRALRLAQEIEFTRAPAALASLRASLSQTSLAYLETTEAVADWVGTPTPEREQAAQTALAASRELLAQVEKNRWLQEPGSQLPEGDADDMGDELWMTPEP